MWVDREWKAKYWEEVNKNKTVILPILLEDCNIPILLKSKKYADFRYNYHEGLKQLLSVLEDSSSFPSLKAMDDKLIKEQTIFLQLLYSKITECSPTNKPNLCNLLSFMPPSIDKGFVKEAISIEKVLEYCSLTDKIEECYVFLVEKLRVDWARLLPEFKEEIIANIQTTCLRYDFSDFAELTAWDRRYLQVSWAKYEKIYLFEKEKILDDLALIGFDLRRNVISLHIYNYNELWVICCEQLGILIRKRVELDFDAITDVFPKIDGKLRFIIESNLEEEYHKLRHELHKTVFAFLKAIREVSVERPLTFEDNLLLDKEVQKKLDQFDIIKQNFKNLIFEIYQQ